MEKSSADISNQALPMRDNVVTVHTKPYEIKTLRIEFSERKQATVVEP
jgi:hypothetical protein